MQENKRRGKIERPQKGESLRERTEEKGDLHRE